MNSLALKGLINRIYSEFDISSFDNRLKLQKMIYLIQEVGGIDLGYQFSLYHHGPYCPELTKTAFYIEDFTGMKEDVVFEDEETEKKFQDLIGKVDKFKEDVDWLEIASTIILFSKLYPKLKDVNIIKHIHKIKPQYEPKTIEKVWGEMKSHQINCS